CGFELGGDSPPRTVVDEGSQPVDLLAVGFLLLLLALEKPAGVLQPHLQGLRIRGLIPRAGRGDGFFAFLCLSLRLGHALVERLVGVRLPVGGQARVQILNARLAADRESDSDESDSRSAARRAFRFCAVVVACSWVVCARTAATRASSRSVRERSRASRAVSTASCAASTAAAVDSTAVSSSSIPAGSFP